MMRILSLLLGVMIACFSVTAVIADSQEGIDLHDRGDDVNRVNELQLWAEQGHATAQFLLGVMYDNGRGVAEDDREAVRWYRKAAEQGHATAQSLLGVMYANGEGVPEDDREAVRWFRKAAEQGDADAQHNLGVMYAKGEGVPQDDVRAYLWFNLAAALGNKDAVRGRDIIKERMTRAQIAEAQRLSREWRPQKERSGEGGDHQSSRTSSEQTRSLSATGSGFRVDDRGAILTNHHVVEECTTVKVDSRPAPLRSADAHNDLALLRGTPSANIARFRSGRGVRVGDDVVVAGYPLRGVLGGGLNIGTGTVASLAGLGNDSRELQITAPVNSGNSGGPLLDQSGRVVGVIVSKVNAVKSAEVLGDVIQGANFAIKANVAQGFLDMNGVDYQFSTNSKRRKTADIAEEARGYTVLVECWK